MTSSAADSALLQRKLARESAARREAEALLETKSRELYAANVALSEANQALTLARARAEDASRAKSLFIANMSHELLTPMNAIIGLSQLLQNTVLDGNQLDYLHTISVSAQRLLAILHDILDISAIESGRLTLEAAWFRVDYLIDDVVALSLPAARTKGIEIIPDCAPVAGIGVCADRDRLGQALNKLVQNAVKFTERGQVLLSARLVAREEGEPLLEVSIRDTGIGIDALQQARIFEPFEQVDQGAGKRHGGVGLGLPILKNLVRLMGGDLSLSSALGHGSTFVLRIPARQVRREPLVAAAQEGREGAAEQPAEQAAEQDGRSPLDVPALRRMLDAGDVRSIDYLKCHESALRAHLGSDYMRFASAVRHYDFLGAASIIGDPEEGNEE